jgi:hypothetical protein
MQIHTSHGVGIALMSQNRTTNTFYDTYWGKSRVKSWVGLQGIKFVEQYVKTDYKVQR